MASKPKRRDFEEKPYRVGYGRPPEKTRFKPNQSGNPKGRPRRIPTLHAVVSKVLGERIKVREGERVVQMSNLDALVRSAVRRFLNGDPRSLRTLNDMMRIEAGEGPSEQEITAHTNALDKAIVDDFLARHGIENGGSDERADETTAEPDQPSEAKKPSGGKP